MHFFDKSLSSFLRVTSLKFIGNLKNGVADVFKTFLGCFEQKINFVEISHFLSFFAYPGSCIFLINH